MPYWLNGVLPLVFQIRDLADKVDSTGYNLTAVVISQLHAILHNQRSGAYGEDSLYDNWNLGTWNVVRVFLMYMSAQPESAPEFGPFVVGYIAHAQRMLLAKGWRPNMASVVCTGNDQWHPGGYNVTGGGHCAVRYPDWMWILQEMVEAPYLQPYIDSTTRATILQHIQSTGDWGTDFTTAFGTPCDQNTDRTGLPNCFPKDGCNSYRVAPRPNCSTVPQETGYFTHGVSGMAMALKEGGVRWRASGGDPAFHALTHRKLELMDLYHGQPTGMFAADEHLAGNNPSRGTELCSIVEVMFSLRVLHQVEGNISYIDRMERVAFNALPAALTEDMWGHNYLSTPNEITAERSPKKAFGDNENATIYGLADEFTHVTPCCTANHNQGWCVETVLRCCWWCTLFPRCTNLFVVVFIIYFGSFGLAGERERNC